MRIKHVHARVIPNSRGEDTIEVVVNKKYKASAPSGASVGTHEIQAFPKQGVRYAVNFVNTYPNFSGFSLDEFKELAVFDHLLPVLGANTIVALQLACLKAMGENNVWSFLNPRARKLPIPLGNCIGGGAHTHLKSADVQEYLLIPKAKTFQERMVINRHLYVEMGKRLHASRRTDEGAWIPTLSTEETFAFLSSFLEQHFENNVSVSLGVDMAASQLYKNNLYHYKNFSVASRKRVLTRKQQIAYVRDMISRSCLSYVEDPLHEEDFDGFAQIPKKNVLVCGDDLITTNMERFRTALKHRSVNAIIVKPNQIGSLVQTKALVDEARKRDVTTVISHRSGETMDTSIAHLAVGWNIPYIKTGIYGKEREAKLLELCRIERELL